MKKLCIFTALSLAAVFLFGCSVTAEQPQVAATTLPVFEFTRYLCDGTDIEVAQLVTESVSCLHDYTLQVSQIRTVEAAQVIVQSGAGLEDSLADILNASGVVDASQGIALLCSDDVHTHDHDHDHGHSHEQDPHIWLSPANAKVMAGNICTGLSEAFPQHSETFEANLNTLVSELDTLQAYGKDTLSQLRCRELITFHDGFSYFADAFDLNILRAVEEESGSEATAAELVEMIGLVTEHSLPAIFTETNGSTAAASVIAAETGVSVFTLDMAIAADSYFDAMYHNINTIKEALG